MQIYIKFSSSINALYLARVKKITLGWFWKTKKVGRNADQPLAAQSSPQPTLYE
jgi:hypothetical protein